MDKHLSKVVPLKQALEKYVKNGCHISIWAFTLNRNPMAAVYEMIRQKIKDRHFNAGSYVSPEIRFSGSHGGCDVASFAPRCIAFMQHEKLKFVKKLDYFTSPGQLRGEKSWQTAGLRPGGVSGMVTNLGVMRFDKDTGRMCLDKFYPGFTLKKVLKNTELIWVFQWQPKRFHPQKWNWES